MYDLLIIGGGPAGVAAGVYAARKQLKTLLVTKEFGGQSVVSTDIQNWIGTISISGDALAKSLKAHLDAYKGEYVTVRERVTVDKLAGEAGAFTVTLSDGSTAQARTVLIASGASRRQLTVPGAHEHDQKGLTYCASCDGPLFSGLDVAVIGGGNAGFETALQLLAYTKSVTLLDLGPRFKADPVTVEKALADPKMRALSNAETQEVYGDPMVAGLRYKDTVTGEVHDLPVQGIFVEIGVVPATGYARDLITLDPFGRVVTDPKNQRTSREGVWAAGDCTDELYHQNNIAAGDAVKALEDIYVYLKTR